MRDADGASVRADDAGEEGGDGEEGTRESGEEEQVGKPKEELGAVQLVQGRWRGIAEAHVDLAEGDGGVDDGESLYFVRMCLFQRRF